MFGIDDAMADVVTKSTQPALAAIKLAWWRERLEELDQGKVPAEPRLQAAARELLTRGITGADLAALEQGWAELLSERPNADVALDRGARLFSLAAQIIGVGAQGLDQTGRLFAAADLKRRTFAIDNVAIVDLPAIPRNLRRFTGLASLAVRDLRHGQPFEREATPGRAWTLLLHRITGRL